MVYERAFGISLPHKAAFQYKLDIARPVARPQLKAGDLVFFYDKRFRRIGHVGIYLNNGYFIHSMIRKGVVISQSKWQILEKILRRCPQNFEKIADKPAIGQHWGRMSNSSFKALPINGCVTICYGRQPAGLVLALNLWDEGILESLQNKLAFFYCFCSKTIVD
ncbi:MAG: NlpC/P60 family protein [candidate division KSB1 bacterium]|nr:NlpC/P60 family protein [candidate division KSB1 bacterium]